MASTSPVLSRILVSDPLHKDGLALLEGRKGISVETHTSLDETALCACIGEYDALIVRSKTQVTARILEAGKRLRVIGRAGIGIDNIDLAAATERGIVVVNTPDANATTTAELAIAHLFSMSRNLPQADRSVRLGEWSPARFMGAELAGKTLGIIGFGTIGRLVATRCMALNMRVIVFDPFVTAELIEKAGVAAAGLDELLVQADYVTLHCPLTEKTSHILNAPRLAAMKRGARLINCARGGLIDENALYEVLGNGHLAAAALDVYEHEPPKDSPLLRLNNIVFTPHLGASTSEAQRAVSLKIASDVIAFLETGTALNAVNLPRISSDDMRKTAPYRKLATALGRLLGTLGGSPISALEVCLYGVAAASLDRRPITAEALVGLLSGKLEGPVNQVNALQLAHRQGIEIRETRCEEVHDYVSLIQLRATSSQHTCCVAGTLLDGQHPRLVRIDDYAIEAVLNGNILFTRHEDRPGVVGALGNILGSEGINISNMQVGVSDSGTEAIALIGVSAPIPAGAMLAIQAHPAIHQAVLIKL